MLDLRLIFLRFVALILGIDEVSTFPPPLSKEEEFDLFTKNPTETHTPEISS